MFSVTTARSDYSPLMPTLFQIIVILLMVLLALGGLGAVRRHQARSAHGKELGKAKPSDARDL